MILFLICVLLQVLRLLNSLNWCTHKVVLILRVLLSLMMSTKRELISLPIKFAELTPVVWLLLITLLNSSLLSKTLTLLKPTTRSSTSIRFKLMFLALVMVLPERFLLNGETGTQEMVKFFIPYNWLFYKEPWLSVRLVVMFSILLALLTLLKMKPLSLKLSVEPPLVLLNSSISTPSSLNSREEEVCLLGRFALLPKSILDTIRKVRKQLLTG